MSEDHKALEVEIANLQRDSGNQHQSIGYLRADLAAHSSEIAVLKTLNTSLERDLEDVKAEFGERLSKLGKNIWVVSTTLASLFIALIGVLKGVLF